MTARPLPPARHRLLRLEALTPTHVGSAWGEASLDRPTQKDAGTGLPFLPDSVLKGVLAGRTELKQGPQERERLYGSPDRPESEKPGEPGPVVLGNGELLCFPVPTTDGQPAWVFPALNLAWALRMEGKGADYEGAQQLVAWIQKEEGPKALAWPRPPRLDTPVPLELQSGPSARRHGSAVFSLLRRWSGPNLREDAFQIVVSSWTAAKLWRSAAERRTLVALDNKRRTVASGALRQVELIPAGTRFLTLLTFEDPDLSLPLPERFQVGAWEGLGLGWLQPEWLSIESSSQEERHPVAGSGEPLVDLSLTMVDAHRAVTSARQESPEFRRTLKAVIRQFGGRAQFGGLEAALAFELAKAKPAQPRPRTEARAHRWLLTALIQGSPESPPTSPSETLLQWLQDDPFVPAKIESSRERLLARWSWLARYAEYGLDDSETIP